MAAMQRIGIFRGAFDPIHNGHIRSGLALLNAGYLDRLMVMPACDPDQKACKASAEDRWKMVVSACACDKRLIPSRLDMDRVGTACIPDMLAAVHMEYPKAELFYVLGSDALMNLRHQPRIRESFPHCTFMILPRYAGVDPAAVSAEISCLSSRGARFVSADTGLYPVSSASVRASLSSGRVPDDLDASVREYCRCKGLYGIPGRLENIDNWIDQLFAALKPRRFAHSLSVAWTSVLLADIYGLDRLRAEQAGLLHDCAKCLPAAEMQRIAVDHAVTDEPEVLSSPQLLHSLVGAWVAENCYGMTDAKVLQAIRYHNTGHKGMSRLDMCVCLADFMEPLRESFPLLEEVRILSRTSLEKALLLSLEGTVRHVLANGWYLYPRTQETISWLQTLPAVKE